MKSRASRFVRVGAALAVVSLGCEALVRVDFDEIPSEECPAGFTLCQQQCIDLSRDQYNCGACAHICIAGEQCIGGECQCTSGLRCGNFCVQPGDPYNCGGCGVVCGLGSMCCANQCIDVQSDDSNCGYCGFPCAFGEVCQNGFCFNLDAGADASDASDAEVDATGDAEIDATSDAGLEAESD